MNDINISKLAELARIDLSDDEKKDLERDVENILSYVTQIQNVEVSPEESRSIGDVYNIMREDEGAHESGMYTDRLMNEAPKKVTDGDNVYVSVKKIL